MVNYLILTALFISSTVFSGEFTASVNRNQINSNDNFALNLTLKDAQAKGNPNIEELQKSFMVHSQQQTSNTVIMNGQVTVSTGWRLVVTPLSNGELVVPSITLNTSEGPLSTKPIKINVVKGEKSVNPSKDEVTFTATVNNASPYKNEPITYKVNLISHSNLANLQIPQVVVQDAIVEPDGQPKQVEKVLDGVPVKIIELNYLITPLKPGKLTIPSMTIQGGILVRMQPRSFFDDDDFDPFPSMAGFNQLKPFGIKTEEIHLDVQAPVADVNPWLPAKSIKIMEVWDDKQVKQVGEPLVRTFKILAEGIRSSQLPELNDQHNSIKGFKVYADKPEFKDEVTDGLIKSQRTEQFTLMPQKAGSLKLPEISITWWDSSKKEKVVTKIPERIVEILAPTGTTDAGPIAMNEAPITVKEIEKVVVTRDPLLYVIIGVLSLLLTLSIIWTIILQKRLLKKDKGSEKRRLPDLNPT